MTRGENPRDITLGHGVSSLVTYRGRVAHYSPAGEPGYRTFSGTEDILPATRFYRSRV